MTTTNQHTFHNLRLLQNARALHPDCYKQFSNRFCVNKRILTPTGDMVPMQMPEPHLNLIPETTLPHLPSFWYDNEETPQAAPEPAVTTPATTTGKSRMVWKPGHGAIEKVDRLTGEIMHLVEEFMEKNNRMQPQTA